MVLSLEESTFKLRFNREAGSNFVQLFCQESARATVTDIPDAYFFIDDSLITRSDSGPFTHSNSGSRLEFIITRDLEGFYSCGNKSTRPLSNGVPLVGKYYARRLAA